MILSNAFCFFSAAFAIAVARSTSICRSSTSVDNLCFVFSNARTFWFNDSIVSSASASRACSFLFASSNSSALATPSDSYLVRHSWASAFALLNCLWRSAFPSASSSTCSRMLSKSCSRLRNLPSRVALSLDSSSANRFVSSSWVVSDILIFDNWFTCDSASSNCLNRSLFSIDSFFFAASKSFNVRFTSSNLPWVSFNWCCNCFTIFSWAAYFLFFFEKENVYNTTPVARKFPSNSLFQQLFYCNYYIWNVQTRLYLQRKASSKEGEKEEEEEKHTRRGGTTSSASWAHNFSNDDKIVCRFVAAPPCSYFGREKAVSRVSPIEIVLFDEPVLPFRCSVGLPMRACRLIRWSIGPCPFQPWYSFKNRRKLLINNSRLGGKKKIIIIVIIKK